ncbi:GerAB/ArcD/ProY family transporter [Schinkia azotoformans]|uniref:GerAB/ArcD/ProY family transporter n=1 Tax=Schinkia azotoformans TaxID=1454 RepID=UPI002DBE06F6|nr:GerAB/ArcD/ProY family transporter [Schinkia azotoformans]MEC1717031.1 GerAB/ArcD/ProY family transporter [Schinkia azotoformans]MEC1741335.1 GerAB/ArcD/ProY family transporter [Schinkia azotoformans]MEC1747474.1 GerAB/ArcD/ProY family transporter [Schinkia azotoformans]MEC1758087.1 GerAB/ArcD/ProY family transporter [Schinkia azotoformans]MEC1769185.1 GerAB/ArcD/ProY family transporter [Schinkia azotoformans]
MEKTVGKIGIREYVAIILLVVGVKLADDTPAILVEPLGSAYWMVPLINGILSFIPIYLMIKVITLYKNKNLHDCIIHLFGKYIGNSLSTILLLLGICALIVDSAVYVDIISTMYFTNSPPLIIFAVLMTTSAYIAKKGLEHLGTISWLVLFYLLISIFMALLFSLQDGNGHLIFPIFGPGVWEVIKESTSHVSIYADFFFLGLIAPYLVSAKAFKKGTITGLCIVSILICFSFLIYLFVFDYEGLNMVNYPFHELIRLIRLGFLTNVETFFFPFWVVATFIRFSFYLYLIALFLGGICNIKNFEYLIPTIATITVIIGMAPDAPTFTIFTLREMLLEVTSPVFLFFPCFMWLIAKLKGEFKHDKANRH